MIIIDPPAVVWRGRLWSHLASDTSFDELHAFAASVGIPERGFDRDHYDVPDEWYDAMVDAGATPVSSRELASALRRAGLRRPKPQGVESEGVESPEAKSPPGAQSPKVELLAD